MSALTRADDVRRQCDHVSDLCASVSSAATPGERRAEIGRLTRNVEELQAMSFRKNAELSAYRTMVLARSEKLLSAPMPIFAPRAQVIDLFDALKRSLVQ